MTEARSGTGARRWATRFRAAGLATALVCLAACGRSSSPDGAGPDAEPPPAANEVLPQLPEVEIPEELAPVLDPWLGDLDGIVERRRLRVGVVHSSFFLYFERGRPRGLTYELLRQFERELNGRLGLKTAGEQIHVVLVPMRRDQLVPWLEEGRIDLAAGNLTVTPERTGRVAFSEPVATGIREILVTGPAAPPPGALEDLAGRAVVVRASSSYHESLQALNTDFETRGLQLVEIVPAYEVLEDEDIVSLVAAGLVEATVVDSHKAAFLESIHPGIELHPDIALREDGEIAWAFRRDSPQLAREVNHFVAGHKLGTLVGNVLAERYIGNQDPIVNALGEQGRQLLSEEAALFRKYGAEYDIHWLMLAAQAYQESRLDQNKRSRSGARGIMQIKPSTARDRNVAVSDISTMDGNIHAGSKYLRFLMDRYFSDERIEPMDRWLLGLAAYNAGPARIANLRSEAEKNGLDPDRWFDNVELVAARRIGRETVTYVRNVVSYYLAYRMAFERAQLRAEARVKAAESGG
jgi:membrane-bound lytic murein transglycosylase MltF